MSANTECLHVYVSHSPNPLCVRIKKRRPLWGGTENHVIVSSILVIEVRGVEEVKALQGALYCQTEAGRPASVTRQTALRGRREEVMGQ